MAEELGGLLQGILDYVEANVPLRYRTTVLAALLAWALPSAPGGAPSPQALRPELEADPWAPHRPLLASRGRWLDKSLVALAVADRHLGRPWLTPAEVTQLLRLKAGVANAHRPNISNALRRASGVVRRRRRGRGFEYRISRAGLRAVERQGLSVVEGRQPPGGGAP